MTPPRAASQQGREDTGRPSVPQQPAPARTNRKNLEELLREAGMLAPARKDPQQQDTDEARRRQQLEQQRRVERDRQAEPDRGRDR